jgi:hypothetical protein
MSSLAGYSPLNGPTGLSGFGRGGNKIPSGYKSGQIQQFTPQQMQLFQQMFGQVSPENLTGRLAAGDKSQFDQMEAPALRQFGALQGNMASRFSGMGSGARRSSGFQNTMNESASDFAQQLQAQRMGLQQQAIRDLMGMSSTLLGQRPYEQFMVQKQRKPSFLQSLLGGAAPLAGAGIGAFFGGPMGMAAGSQIGSAFGQGIMGNQGQGMDYSSLSGLPNRWGV